MPLTDKLTEKVSTKIFILLITGFSMLLLKFIILLRLKGEAFMELREVEALSCLGERCIQDQRKSSEIFWAPKIENFCGNRRLS